MGAITRGFANNITTSGKLLQSSISGGLGLTGADQWRVTSDFTPGGNVTANWERNDTNFDKIGTGMSESSGVRYLVCFLGCNQFS